MDLINFIVWLTAGAVIGWFANQMVTGQHHRHLEKITPSEEDRTEKT